MRRRGDSSSPPSTRLLFASSSFDLLLMTFVIPAMENQTRNSLQASALGCRMCRFPAGLREEVSPPPPPTLTGDLPVDVGGGADHLRWVFTPSSQLRGEKV